jgi:hypothetical protein
MWKFYSVGTIASRLIMWLYGYSKHMFRINLITHFTTVELYILIAMLFTVPTQWCCTLVLLFLHNLLSVRDCVVPSFYCDFRMTPLLLQANPTIQFTIKFDTFCFLFYWLTEKLLRQQITLKIWRNNPFTKKTTTSCISCIVSLVTVC